MKNLIIKFAWWLLDKAGESCCSDDYPVYEYDLPEIDNLLLETTKEVIKGPWAEEHSGEYKRHQVYAKLIKQFPNVPKKHVALAIEIAVCSTEQ